MYILNVQKLINYLIRRVAVRIGRPVFVVFVPLPGPMLNIFGVAVGCGAPICVCPNAFGAGELNEKPAGVAAGAVAGPPNPNDFDASVALAEALNENDGVAVEKTNKK